MKKYKLNITPFLNTQLEPLKSASGNLYPLYYRLVYQRKSTMIKSISGEYFKDIEDEKAQLVITEEVKEIEGLAQYLTDFFTQSMELSGFKEKYIKAQELVKAILDQDIRNKIRLGLEKVTNPIKAIINTSDTIEDYPLELLLEGLEKLFTKKELDLAISKASIEMTIYHFLDLAHEGSFAEKKVIAFLNAEIIDKKFLFSLRKEFEKEQAMFLYEELITLLTTYITKAE